MPVICIGPGAVQCFWLCGLHKEAEPRWCSVCAHDLGPTLCPGRGAPLGLPAVESNPSLSRAPMPQSLRLTACRTQVPHRVGHLQVVEETAQIAGLGPAQEQVRNSFMSVLLADQGQHLMPHVCRILKWWRGDTSPDEPARPPTLPEDEGPNMEAIEAERKAREATDGQQSSGQKPPGLQQRPGKPSNSVGVGAGAGSGAGTSAASGPQQPTAKQGWLGSWWSGSTSSPASGQQQVWDVAWHFASAAAAAAVPAAAPGLGDAQRCCLQTSGGRKKSS